MDFASIVFGLLEAESQFPVDFDLAWQWIGYSRKDNAKSALENAGFLAGTDFQVFLNIQIMREDWSPPWRLIFPVM